MYMHGVKVRLRGGNEVIYDEVLSVEFAYGGEDEFDTMDVSAYDNHCFSVRSNNAALVAMGEAANVLHLIPHKQWRELIR